MEPVKLWVVGLVLALSAPLGAAGPTSNDTALTSPDPALMAEALEYEQEYRLRMATLHRLREIAQKQHRTPRLKSLDRMSERVFREHEKLLQAVASDMTPEGRQSLQEAISSKQDQGRPVSEPQEARVSRPAKQAAMTRSTGLTSRETAIQAARSKITVANASAEYDRLCDELKSIVSTSGTRPHRNKAVGKSSNTISVKLPQNCRGPSRARTGSRCSSTKVIKVTRKVCPSQKSGSR